jgi:Transcriptional regulators
VRFSGSAYFGKSSVDMTAAASVAQEANQESMSVASVLARRLQDAIDNGEFLIGTSLPSERELMMTYNVSRASVREALRVLSARGLIKVKRGRTGGSFISSPTESSLVQSLNQFIKGQDIRFIDLVFAREAIEPMAAYQAALTRTEEQLEDLRIQCVECERTIGNVEEFVQSNLNWHQSVVEASGNPLFVAFLKSISGPLHTATNLEVFDFRLRKAVVGVHWQIFDAIRQGDAEAARRRMTRHLTAYGEKLSDADLAE